MHRDVDAGEVQHGRQDSPHGDLAVRLTSELRHQKGSGTHDGGHDLAAGGCSRFHSAGKFALVAGFLHHGDGDGTGGNGVAHGGAGHHAAQGGGDDSHLGGTARGSAGHSVGQVDEELGNARPLQEGAEDDEHHNELGAHADGAAENAVVGVEHGADHLVDGQLHLVRAGRTHQVKEGVDQQHTGHAQNGQAHAPAAQLHQCQDADEADNHIQIILHDPGRHLNNVLGVDGIEEISTGADNQQNDIIPRHVVDPGVTFPRREGQKAEQQDQTHEHRQSDLLHGGKEHGVNDAIEGKQHHQPADDQFRHAFPDPGVGLPVVFFHDRLNIRGGADRRIVLFKGGRRCLLRLFLFEQSHWVFPLISDVVLSRSPAGH